MQTAKQQIADIMEYAAKEVVRITENIPAFELVQGLLEELEKMNVVASGYWCAGWKPDVVLNIALQKGESFICYAWLLTRITDAGYTAEKTHDYESRRTFPFRKGGNWELGVRIIIDASQSKHCKQVKTGERIVSEYKLVCEDDTPPEVEPETLTDYRQIRGVACVHQTGLLVAPARPPSEAALSSGSPQSS